MSIQEHQKKFITKQVQIFFLDFMKKMYLMKRNLRNILILKRVNFFLIGILQVNVRVVKIKMLMEISVKFAGKL